mmetsp:Transcript_28406/g.48003  ORF Transcript_28406/g.48003 Transcript_28406/m.48003 type:complete len:1133 (+) Transcript_28406:49-3447(+)
MLGLVLLTCGSYLVGFADSTNIQRTWTYQSSIRVDSMGMEGSAFAMHGRGLTTIAQGSDLIYEDATSEKPSAVWVGSCVYETDENFVRCVNRKSPVYNVNSNKPVCTKSPDPTIHTPDPSCDGPGTPGASYQYYTAPYDPTTPASVANNVGDEYGAHVSLAGDLEVGSLMAVGAPSTYTSPATFYETFGAVYMHSGEYKRWTENQRLVASDSNSLLTANRPNFGKIVEIDRVTSRTALVTCPQCVSASLTEGAVYVYKTENGKSWTATQQLMADDATTSDYSFGLNLKVHDDFAMIAAQGLSMRGALYMFREERHSVYKGGVYNGRWTQQQKLIPRDAYIRGQATFWGNSADMHGKTLVVGMQQEPNHGVNTGAAYVYKSSKTMEIPHHQANLNGRRSLSTDGVHVMDVKPKPIPMHKWWTQVQKLYPADPHIYRLFGNEVAIWGDVIAVMGKGESLSDADWNTPGTNYQFGSVYMFARDGFSSDSWTQQQKLYNPDAADGTFFTESVDTNYQGNTIGAGDLDNNRFGVPRLHGSSLTLTSYGDTPYSAFTYFMSDNVNWKCLQITVGDGMGDGWDNARLVATAPTGPDKEIKHDTYAQFCDAYNYDKSNEKIPLSRKYKETYRYCPLSSQDEGNYVFEIMGNPRGKKGNKGTPSDDLYWREIYWEIYNEFDRKRYMGDAHTKLTFNWGRDDFFFTEAKVEREFKPPAVCKQCNVWEGLKSGPKKPSPAVKSSSADDDRISRRLNTYPTPSPTTSLSPTLVWDTSDTDQWTFYMGRDTTGTPSWGSKTAWFDESQNGTGTWFYIYDSNGLNITEPLISGQLCSMTGTIADSCSTQVLPEGTYTLRVTGGTDYRRDEIQWKFCNRVGTAMQSLVFTKYSSTCLPLTQYSSVQLCEQNGFIVYTSVGQVLKGLIGLYSEERDSSIVISAMKTMLLPFVPSKVHVIVDQERLQNRGDGVEDVQLTFELEFDSEENSINVMELDGLHNFETRLAEHLSYFDDSRMISSLLNTAAHDILGDARDTIMYGESFESHITSIQLISAEPKKMKLFHDRVRTHDDAIGMDVGSESSDLFSPMMDHDTQIEYNVLKFEAIAGYVVMALVVLAAVLVSWRRQVKKRRQHMQELGLIEPLESGV